MTSTNEIKKATFYSYLGIFLNIVVGLLFTPWLVKNIGTSDYALYSLIAVFLSYFTMDYGLSESTARFIAKYRAQNEEKINSFLGLIFKMYLIISAIICLIFIGTYFFIDEIFLKLTTLEIEKFKIIYIISAFFTVIMFPFTPLNGMLIAYEKFTILKITDIVTKIGSVLLMVIFLLSGGGVYALVAINSSIAFLVLVFKWIYIKRKTQVKVDIFFQDIGLLKEIFRTSAWFTIITVCKRLLINLSPTLLGILSGSKHIAIFSIAMMLEGYIYNFSSAINGFFLSRIARIISKTDDRSEVLELMIKTGRIQLLVIGIIYIGFITVGKEFILLWMGSDFLMAYYVTISIIIVSFFTLTQDVANSLLSLGDGIKYKAFSMTGAVITSVGLSVILIPKLGSLGAGISNGISFFVFHFLVMNLFYYYKMKLNIVVFFKEVYGKMFTGLLSSLLFAFLICYFLPASNFYFLVVKVILISVFYGIAMWYFAMNKFEKNLIKTALK